jgi:hypothetical protein
VVAALLVPSAFADDHKPPKPKPKPPELELLTDSQQAALRQNRVKFLVESKKGRRTKVIAELIVEGIPEDYHFNLKPQRKKLHDNEAKIKIKLSQRQREVLAFGEQACMAADVNAQAKVGKRKRTIHDSLRKSPGC